MSREARKSDSVGQIVFVNVTYKPQKRATAAFSTHVWLALICHWQQSSSFDDQSTVES